MSRIQNKPKILYVYLSNDYYGCSCDITFIHQGGILLMIRLTYLHQLQARIHQLKLDDLALVSHFSYEG